MQSPAYPGTWSTFGRETGMVTASQRDASFYSLSAGNVSFYTPWSVQDLVRPSGGVGAEEGVEKKEGEKMRTQGKKNESKKNKNRNYWTVEARFPFKAGDGHGSILDASPPRSYPLDPSVYYAEEG